MSADPELQPDLQPGLQPWLHDLDVCVRGPVTCVAARDGDLAVPGGGLFVDDRRALSRSALRYDGREAVPVSSHAAGGSAVSVLVARRLGDEGPDPTVVVRRVRTLHDSGMREEVAVSSSAGALVRTELTVVLGGDGADISAVKAGADPGAPATATPCAGTGGVVWEDGRHRTSVTAERGAARPLPDGGAELTWALEVEPGGTATVAYEVAAARLAPTGFDPGTGAGLVDWSGFTVAAEDHRLDLAVATSVRDLAGLLQTDPDAPHDVFAAAGSPWYLTLFGRDSLITARLGLVLGTDVARGTLRALARRQGRRTDPVTAEEPGKILHEVRRGDATPRPGQLPPVYYGTVDATPLWVTLLHDAWRWGLPTEEVPALRGPLDAALGWLRTSVERSPDGLLRYHDATGGGLSNQGWKDSGDAMRHRDGRIARAPIALVEPQAYAVRASRQAADLREAVLGEDGADLRAWADDLAARVRAGFWVEDDDGRYLAMALDADGAPVDGVGSNMGHVLGTGTLDRAEAAAVAGRLAGPDLLGPFGIGTLGRDNPAFNPIGYHTGSVWVHDTALCAQGLAADGFEGAAGTAVRALVDAVTHTGFRAPELYGGDASLGRPLPYPASCRPQAWAAASLPGLVATLLGLDPDVPNGRLTLRPLRPAPFGSLTVTGLRVGRAVVSVSVDAHGEVLDVQAPDWLEVVLR